MAQSGFFCGKVLLIKLSIKLTLGFWEGIFNFRNDMPLG
jgi:hypothetical protein